MVNCVSMNDRPAKTPPRRSLDGKAMKLIRDASTGKFASKKAANAVITTVPLGESEVKKKKKKLLEADKTKDLKKSDWPGETFESGVCTSDNDGREGGKEGRVRESVLHHCSNRHALVESGKRFPLGSHNGFQMMPLTWSDKYEQSSLLFTGRAKASPMAALGKGSAPQQAVDSQDDEWDDYTDGGGVNNFMYAVHLLYCCRHDYTQRLLLPNLALHEQPCPVRPRSNSV